MIGKPPKTSLLLFSCVLLGIAGQTFGALPDDRSVNLPDGRSVNLPDGRSVNLPDGRSVNLPDGRSINARTGEIILGGGPGAPEEGDLPVADANSAKFRLDPARPDTSKAVSEALALEMEQYIKDNAEAIGLAVDSANAITSECAGIDSSDTILIKFGDEPVGRDIILAAIDVVKAEFRLVILAEVCETAIPVNHLARGILQSGITEVEEAYPPEGLPFSWPQNLLGQDQVVGVCDTGIDMNHCFFSQEHQDPRQPWTGDYVPPLPLANKQFRKVVQYVTFRDDMDLDGHGTHVAGTVAGELDIEDRAEAATATGSLNSLWSGMAPQAKLAFFDVHREVDEGGLYVPADVRDVYAFAYAAGARIHSNSWGYNAPGTDPINFYAIDSYNTDDYMYNNRDFLVLFAAGNRGACGASATITPPATAKNIVSVGASANTFGFGIGLDDYQTDENRDTLAEFSGQGPTNDGRTKPDVVAPGQWVLSAQSNQYDQCALTYFRGTSMATPAVAGIVALIRQYFTDGFYPTGLPEIQDSFTPSGSLMKAMLIAGAQPMRFRQQTDDISEMCPAHGLEADFTSKPDQQQGWGRVQLDKSLFFEPNKLLVVSHTPDAPEDVFNDAEMPANATTWPMHTYDVCVHNTLLEASADTRLSIVLVWTDAPGASLVNDLDLLVNDEHSAGVWHWGNGGTAADTLNPVERVSIELDNSEANTTVHMQVVNSGISEGETQPYSLVAIVDGEQLTISNGPCTPPGGRA